MTRANAYYQMLLLKCGFTEQYDSWFDTLLETEDPISEETLGLVGKGNDINAIISYLEYVSRGDRDEYEACRSVRLFLREEYRSGRLTIEKCIETMYIISVYNKGYWEEPWADMYYLSDYYDLAVDGICLMSDFEKAFTDYLETGKYLDWRN